MSIEFDGRKDAMAIRYEQRDLKGVVMRSGVTGGARAWVMHPKFGRQNIMKRVKSALGWRWNVKTEKARGDGDVVRKLENGSTLHIWLEEHAMPSVNHVGLMADRVSSGLMTLGDVTSYALETLSESEFDACDDWRDAVENELAKRELGI